jgi:hypothetical protein
MALRPGRYSAYALCSRIDALWASRAGSSFSGVVKPPTATGTDSAKQGRQKRFNKDVVVCRRGRKSYSRKLERHVGRPIRKAA